MIPLNTETMLKIVKQDENLSQITILKWNLNNNVIASGANYCSEICRLFIDYEKNGTPHTKSYILKIPANCPMYNFHEKYGAYEKEFLIYSELLPEMRKLDADLFIPKFYLAGDQYSLLLEDLSSEAGYKMLSKFEQLDFQHCKLVFINLAKFHAYTVKLNDLSLIPEKTKIDLKFSRSKTDESVRKFRVTAMENLIKILDPDIKEKYSKQLLRIKDTFVDTIYEKMHHWNSFKVLNYGDCWTPNILFRYKSDGTAESLKFIDFQACRWTSPAFDIIHFTVLSMRLEVFQQHFNELLQIYNETLNDILKSFNLQTYELEELIRDIDHIYDFGLLTCAVMLPVALAKPGEDFNFFKSLQDETIKKNDKVQDSYKGGKYKDVATQWISYYGEKGFFDN